MAGRWQDDALKVSDFCANSNRSESPCITLPICSRDETESSQALQTQGTGMTRVLELLENEYEWIIETYWNLSHGQPTTSTTHLAKLACLGVVSSRLNRFTGVGGKGHLLVVHGQLACRAPSSKIYETCSMKCSLSSAFWQHYRIL